VNIYNDISFKLTQNEIVAPYEFWELMSYFEDLFWPGCYDFSAALRESSKQKDSEKKLE
jgi:hypothetical protein